MGKYFAALAFVISAFPTACSTDAHEEVAGSCGDAAVSYDSAGDAGDSSADVAMGDAVDSGMEDSAIDSTTSGDVGGAECPIKTGGDFCAKIPFLKFAGTQVVDGIGAEFCDVPGTNTILSAAVPYGAPSALPAIAKTRLAWSGAGVHVHIHIDDPHVVGWNPDLAGDGVWLFLGGQAPFYGEFPARAGKDAGFYAIQMTAPSTVNAGIAGFTKPIEATARLFFYGHQRTTDLPTSACGALTVPLYADISFAARLVASGYEFELFVPWRTLGRAVAPAPSDVMSVDLLLFDNDEIASAQVPFTSSDATLHGAAFHHAGPNPSGGSCCSFGGATEYSPLCDSRLWCKSSLE